MGDGTDSGTPPGEDRSGDEHTGRDGDTDRDRPAPNPDALLSYLRNRLGDEVRSCVVYGDGESTPVYVRDDVDSEAARSRVERVSHLYEGERRARDPDPSDPDFGPLYASTHVFGDAIVVHLLDEDGLVVGFSLDHAIGGRLTGFVRDCMDALYDDRSAGW